MQQAGFWSRINDARKGRLVPEPEILWIFFHSRTVHTELFTTQWYIKSKKISKTAISFNPEPR